MNKETQDIAQCIVEALRDKTEAVLGGDAPTFNPQEETLIGEVPKHLRRLFLFTGKLGKKAFACGMRCNEIIADAEGSPDDTTRQEIEEAIRLFQHAKAQHELCKELFFTALYEHLPIKQNDAVITSTRICRGWKVASKDVTGTSQCTDEDGTQAVLLAVLVGAHDSDEPIH